MKRQRFTEDQILLGAIVGFVGLLLVASCARECHLDVETLAIGGYSVRATASTMNEPADSASRHAQEDAASYCKRIGGDAEIKSVNPLGVNFFGTTASAEVEFDCRAIGARDRRP
jgi:queuine/archaeosine tRNA-ribosyltransferase